MKTLTLTFIAIFFSAVTFANGNEASPSDISVSANKSKDGFNLEYSSEEMGKATIKFFDEADHLIRKEIIKSKADWNDTYFFTNNVKLKSMTIQNDNGIYFKELKQKNGQITVENTKSFKVVEINGRVVLNVKGDKLAPIHVRIYDNNRKLVHREVVNQREDFQKAFNIKSLKPGPVYFVVNDYDATYHTHF